MALLTSDYPKAEFSGYWEIFSENFVAENWPDKHEAGKDCVRVYDKNAVVAEKMLSPNDVESFVRSLMEQTRKE